LSVRRACAAVGMSRAAYYRGEGGGALRDGPVIEALNELVERHQRWGFWKCHDRLRLDGRPWNHKRVWRVYRQMRLNLPRRTKKRLPVPESRTLAVPAAVNASWSLDFMTDTLYQGRRFRTLNIFDEWVREALDIVIDTSIPSGRVIRVLDQLSHWRGLPLALRCDNVLTTESRANSGERVPRASPGRGSFSSICPRPRGLPLPDDPRLTIVTQGPHRGPDRTSNSLGTQWKVRALSTRSWRPLRPF
jgi:hypothetical protein